MLKRSHLIQLGSGVSGVGAGAAAWMAFGSRGARFTANLDKALTEPTIIHWHGLHTPARMDGHPGDTIAPGGRCDHDFTVRNPGPTCVNR